MKHDPISTIGNVVKIIESQKPPKIKLVIDDEIKSGTSWAIECRNKLKIKAGFLKPGDRINVSFYVNCRVDKFNNTYNNAIATSLDRL